MKHQLFLKVLIALAVITNFSFAQKLSFPADKPVLMIEFPKSWSVEIDQEEEAGIIATSEDETIEIDLWMLNRKAIKKDPKATITASLIEIEEIISKSIIKFKVIEQGEGEIAGISYFFIEGVGIDKEDGIPTQVYIELLTPDDKTIFAMLYWGSKEDEKKNLKDIDNIFNSIKRAK